MGVAVHHNSEDAKKIASQAQHLTLQVTQTKAGMSIET